VWWGLVAPAGTPGDIVRQLNAETNKSLADPAIAKRLGEIGVVIAPGTPEEFASLIKSQTDLWSGVIKASGIRAD
jgi:tripartite-type tricarboxylate transporter receptor subunit TctC